MQKCLLTLIFSMYTTFDVFQWVQICSFHFKVCFVTSLRGKAHVHICLVASLDKRREKLKQLPSRERSHILFPRHFWVDDFPNFPRWDMYPFPGGYIRQSVYCQQEHQIPRIHSSKGNHEDERGGEIMVSLREGPKGMKKKATQSSMTFAPWHLALEHLGQKLPAQ